MPISLYKANGEWSDEAIAAAAAAKIPVNRLPEVLALPVTAYPIADPVLASFSQKERELIAYDNALLEADPEDDQDAAEAKLKLKARVDQVRAEFAKAGGILP